MLQSQGWVRTFDNLQPPLQAQAQALQNYQQTLQDHQNLQNLHFLSSLHSSPQPLCGVLASWEEAAQGQCPLIAWPVPSSLPGLACCLWSAFPLVGVGNHMQPFLELPTPCRQVVVVGGCAGEGICLFFWPLQPPSPANNWRRGRAPCRSQLAAGRSSVWWCETWCLCRSLVLRARAPFLVLLFLPPFRTLGSGHLWRAAREMSCVLFFVCGGGVVLCCGVGVGGWVG